MMLILCIDSKFATCTIILIQEMNGKGFLMEKGSNEDNEDNVLANKRHMEIDPSILIRIYSFIHCVNQCVFD